MYTHLRTGADEQRTDIERRARFVGRNEAFVELHHAEHGFAEALSAELGHQDAATGGLQTSRILLQTEDTHLAVFATEGFQPFECFLTIVQTGRCHVQRDSLFAANLGLAPSTVTIVNSHVVICLHVAERQISPIKFFHCLNCYINVFLFSIVL